MVLKTRKSKGFHRIFKNMIFITNIEECYPNIKYNLLIAFNDMIADMISNKKYYKSNRILTIR